MVMTAGVLAERVTGQSWEDLVRQRIFLPLGMARSNFSVAGIVRADDYALPYDEHTGSSVIPFRDIGAVGPAGSINSSVEEMIRYVQMQIEGGSYGGKQILSREMAAEIQSPQVTLSRGGPITRISDQDVGPDGLGLSAYGLGLSVTTYRGHKLLLHGGGIDGFLSSVCWMPDAKIGVVVLTNRDGYHPVPTILERNVFDRLLGAEPVDWAGRARAWWAKIQAQFVPAVAAPAASAPAPKTVAPASPGRVRGRLFPSRLRRRHGHRRKRAPGRPAGSSGRSDPAGARPLRRVPSPARPGRHAQPLGKPPPDLLAGQERQDRPGSDTAGRECARRRVRAKGDMIVARSHTVRFEPASVEAWGHSGLHLPDD
jgi:hypothetical protein